MRTEPRRVWLMLVKFKVVGENAMNFTVGSEALVQCFIPVRDSGVAMRECSRLLKSEGLELVEVMATSSFEPMEEYPDAPDFVLQDVARARSSGESITGTFIFSRDTASFEKGAFEEEEEAEH